MRDEFDREQLTNSGRAWGGLYDIPLIEQEFYEPVEDEAAVEDVETAE